MNFNVEKISGQIALYLKLPKKAAICPSCLNNTTKIHDDRIQKIKQLKLFERFSSIKDDIRAVLVASDSPAESLRPKQKNRKGGVI